MPSYRANSLIYVLERRNFGLNDAIAFAKKNGFTELPLQLSIARIRALMNLPESQREQGLAEAAKLIQETLLKRNASMWPEPKRKS